MTKGPTEAYAVVHNEHVAWHLRAIELGNGWWACRWSDQEFDQHPSLEDSLSHLHKLAVQYAPADVYVHHLDGNVSRG